VKDAYLVPHRLEELWEHPSGTLVGSDRGAVVRHRGRLWVLPNGNPTEWKNGVYYAPETDRNAFGGGYLCTAELFMSLKFTDEDEYPVEHATGFTAFKAGRALKTGMWNEFFVEHLSGVEAHRGLAVG